MQHVDHSKNIIELKDVSFGYVAGQNVLDHATLAVHQGDYLGIIGPNGGGKTTLLKIMLGLLKPTSGTVQLFGQDINHFRDWKKIGYVAQRASSFDPNFPVTAAEVVAMGTYVQRGLFHFPTDEDRQNVDRALAQVDMTEWRDTPIGNLSGGQQQRIFIARALAAEPAVIVLDEPTVGVDVTTQEQFYRLLKKLNKELDLTLVLVSHELDVVAHETTEVAFINGTVMYYQNPADLLKGDDLARLYGQEIKHLKR